MIDLNEFFRESTLKICGHLEIEAALHACIGYLSQHIPADQIYLQKYEEDIGAMRIIARADVHEGERMDVLIPLSKQAKAQMNANLRDVTKRPVPVFVINKPGEDPLTRNLLKTLDQPLSSILGIPLPVEGRFIGAVILTAAGDDRFSGHHARLFATLKEPFYVALSNTLKHREVLKLKDMLAEDNRYLHGELRRISGDEIVGTNFGLRQVMHRVEQVAVIESPVLIMGETGTGKDLIAHAIHNLSARSAGPFVGINCGAIPDSLIDSELFGHERGAFTGALSRKRGRFERADKGTIFLDEIGELPPAAQVRLLRVLQNKEIERVGGIHSIPLDIRIIAATNRNLEQMVRSRQFREDLWFRLNVFPILVPPLRDRISDIPALVRHFIEKKAKELKIGSPPILARGAIDTLMAYNWPGNVRELENVIERAMILSRGEPLRFEGLGSALPGRADEPLPAPGGRTLELDALVKRHIEHVLGLTGGKIHGSGGAGELLGVNPDTLRYRMRKLGIAFGRKRK